MILLEKRQYRQALQIARHTIGLNEALVGDAPDFDRLAAALTESVRDMLANRPAYAPAHEESVFARQGDYWAIRYQGHAAFLKASRGLHCLALLLRNPGREFHVNELLAAIMDRPIPAPPAGPRANHIDTGEQP